MARAAAITPMMMRVLEMAAMLSAMRELGAAAMRAARRPPASIYAGELVELLDARARTEQLAQRLAL